MGTCAGLILMSNDVDDERINPLGLFNISISRNAYGRQDLFFKKRICFELPIKKYRFLFNIY